VPADGVDLVGTLRLPAAPGPYAGVVIAHGSGPQSRRGVAPGQVGLGFPVPVPVYEQLADGLRDAGFAVLTFDKRSCGPFNGCTENDYPTPPDDLTFDTFVDDVDRILDHLAEHPDIDRTVLIGHSKGGTIAATLAGRRHDLDAVVLLATPAAPIHEVLAAQAATFADLVDAAGQAHLPAAVQQVDELSTLADQVTEIADGHVDGPVVGGAPRSFWASWIDASRAAPDHLSSSTAPVLTLGGTSDWNVLPVQVEAWRPALAGTDELRILSGITHALTRLDVDDPTAITPADVGTRVDDQVISTVTEWLQTQIN
jgi:alpha-beta hydrolase superfamily lysophospholipase